MKNRSAVFVVALAIMVAMMAGSVSAQAPEANYFGFVYWKGGGAPTGTTVTVYNSRGQLVGSFVKGDGAFYGNLPVPAEGGGIPGAYENERLQFRENGAPVVTNPEEVYWKSGQTLRVDVFGGMSQQTSCGTGSCLHTWNTWARSHPVTQFPVSGLGEEAYQGDAVYNTLRIENDTSPLVPVY